MKKLCALGIFLLVIALSPGSFTAYAFNSATHIYIAERVFPDCNEKIDLYYGSIAPDLALYANQQKWPTAFYDTHYDYIDLSHYSWSSIQKAFAKGWLTHNEHNEYRGADYYAHIEYPPGNTGYVIEKANILFEQTGLDLEFGHFAIEVAIDLLLKNDDPKIAEKLLRANLLRSWQDRHLLARILVWNWKERRTDWVTLAATELTFRNLLCRYAVALALPYPYDRGALAELGSQLAQEFYGIEVSPKIVLYLLESAIHLCKDDYKMVIDDAIEGIKNNL